ncbi:VRR-NUC domain containing protein [Cellulophaga phage phi12:1]|uniref:VRR-NUC domain containing protein n=2 Tax=Cellulophaga phage phi12:1 TaxID=1327976 RepID=R9ZXY3_9CAUD|nr:VRR-NUC domain containing protein [Cellulophaga phage phi12:1]AGO47996.1 VRR-NUC domain containing protein [Cellulophaga phage phi12:1]AGO48161.1 VRR-NUC domain containing protein [Cellulophaga phage phi12:3]
MPIKPFYSDREIFQFIKTGAIIPGPETIQRMLDNEELREKTIKILNLDINKMNEKEQKSSEDRIQADCFDWFNTAYPHLRGLLYHVPNGEKRDPITANKLKAMGVVAGVPDLEFHYHKRTYFIEMKKPGGVVSEAQKKIHAQLDLQGFVVWVVDNMEEFQGIIKSILGDKSNQTTLGLTRADFDYRNGVFNYLYNIKHEEIIDIAPLTKPESRKKFMYYVTEFIVEGFDRLDGFELLFTDDYRGFYKKFLTDKE